MGYTSKFTGAEIDNLLDKVEALPEGGNGGGSAPMMIEVTWEELVALRDAGSLVAGQKYRIIDYETMTSKEGSQAAGHPFDIIVTALDNKTLDEKASAIQSARDTDGYFASSNLAAWDVRYCLDNDTSRFVWAVKAGKKIKVSIPAAGIELEATYVAPIDSGGTTLYLWQASYDSQSIQIGSYTEHPAVGEEVIVDTGFTTLSGTVVSVSSESVSGKGVIYALTDEFNNSAGYDFKNIQFGSEEYWYYTFGEANDGSMDENSVLNPVCSNNIIGEGSWDISINTPCHDNIIGRYCNRIQMGVRSKSNTIGNGCTDIHLYKDSVQNKFGNLCSNITLGDGAECNSFEDNCHAIQMSKTSSSDAPIQYPLGNHFRTGSQKIRLYHASRIRNCDVYVYNNLIDPEYYPIPVEDNSISGRYIVTKDSDDNVVFLNIGDLAKLITQS